MPHCKDPEVHKADLLEGYSNGIRLGGGFSHKSLKHKWLGKASVVT